MNLKNKRFSKKKYRDMLVKEVKEEFGNDVKKYLEWEIEIFLFGQTFFGYLVLESTVRKHKKEIIEYILKKDEEPVGKALLDYLRDLAEKTKKGEIL